MTRHVLSSSLSVAVLLAASACDMNVRVNPEGHRCDASNACPVGYECRAGACASLVGDGCANVVCDMPPATECVGSVLRAYTGRCQAGACLYDPVDTTCTAGCSNAQCNDACTGVVCTTPPGPACVNSTTLATYSGVGTCNSSTGACDYPSNTTICSNGCSNGACVNQNLCLGVTCTTPPAPVCVGSALRTFTLPGTCNMGTGMCEYQQTDVNCPTGCSGGACNVPALSFTQVGPRINFAINAIDLAPASSGNSVLAVGAGGRVMRWNGTNWSPLPGVAAGANLNAVMFATGTVAWMAASNRTVWVLRGGTISQNALPATGRTNPLADLYAATDSNVLVADTGGGYAQWNGSSWAQGTLLAADGPFEMTQAYTDETGRQRIAGRCGGNSCVAYRTSSTSSFFVDTHTTTTPFTAVGPWVDVPGSGGPDGLVGSSPLNLVRHSSIGSFSTTDVPNPMYGEAIVGITGAPVSSGTRAVYVLTKSGTSGGELVRITRTSTNVQATSVLATYFGEEHLSRNESGGVVVAEVRRAQQRNNVFRRGLSTDEALELGEDFTGVTVDASGLLVLATNQGDVARRRNGSPLYDFARGPWVLVRAAEGRNGSGVLTVGREGANTNGAIVHFTSPDTFVRLSVNAPNTTFNAVCRASAGEAWVVGTGGSIVRVNATTPSNVTSPTTRELVDVDCPAVGQAVACGDNGTVLKLNAGTWRVVSPGFPTTQRLSSCRLVNGAIYAAGDGVFYRLDAGGSSWTQLNATARLTSLVVRSPSDIYAVSNAANGSQADVVRFNGANWSRLLTVTGALQGGVQTGGKVVFGGTLGAIVESN